MQITLGISPCPNDTFIFAAIALKLIDTRPFEIRFQYADVEELNHWALQGRLDVTKLSFNAFADVTRRYQLLNSGSALGRGCGPLLISLDDPMELELNEITVVTPGAHTTANFLLDYYHPDARRQYARFDAIEDAILDGTVKAGVIIHENRFTYQQRGLQMWVDLGAHWEEVTGHAIPLGGIVMRRSYPDTVKQELDDLVRRSLLYAYEHTDEIMPYIRSHAQEMEDRVMMQHIDLYVNGFTLDLGRDGIAAVEYFLTELAMRRNLELTRPIKVSKN